MNGIVDSLRSTMALLTVFAIALLLISFCIILLNHRQRFKDAESIESKPGIVYPHFNRFLGWFFVLKMIYSSRTGGLLQFLGSLFYTLGPTFTVRSFRLTTIFTHEPANVKAVMATQFEDWEVGPDRKSLKEMQGESIFLIDGAKWRHMRTMVKSTFDKSRMCDLDRLEHHMQQLFKHIPANGETIDLQYLFFQYTMDASTDLVFGQSTNVLATGQDHFSASFDLVQEDVLFKSWLGNLGYLIRPRGTPQAIAYLRSQVDIFVQRAVARATQSEAGGDSGLEFPEHPHSFLDDLAKDTKDMTVMSDNAMMLLFAGRDTTACLTSSLWAELARHPHVHNRLKKHVDELEGGLPTYEWLRNFKYLKWCTYEAFRLHPAIPILPPRTAKRDTSLPRGGGPDGKEPLHVAKGARFIFDVRSAQTRKDIWGEDAETFRPGRWDGLKPGWDFIPFGGGPRICVGQQFALNEVYYVTVRLIQKFPEMQNRDLEPFIDKIGLTLCSKNGVKVGLYSH